MAYQLDLSATELGLVREALEKHSERSSDPGVKSQVHDLLQKVAKPIEAHAAKAAQNTAAAANPTAALRAKPADSDVGKTGPQTPAADDGVSHGNGDGSASSESSVATEGNDKAPESEAAGK